MMMMMMTLFFFLMNMYHYYYVLVGSSSSSSDERSGLFLSHGCYAIVAQLAADDSTRAIMERSSRSSSYI